MQSKANRTAGQEGTARNPYSVPRFLAGAGLEPQRGARRGLARWLQFGFHPPAMDDVIGVFVKAYERELDFHQASARAVQQHIEAKLRSNGIRAIVTSRAKRPDRLEEKLRKRVAEGHSYRCTDDVREDIADLAGVRVALYFPAQRQTVNILIGTLFEAVRPPKELPEPGDRSFSTTEGPSYTKRFRGYGATHHRVRLMEEQLTDDDRRFRLAVVEIQVASVLMHAWAEVEHDLAYKPISGVLSTEEHSILDELNGLVLAGELALERLDEAMKRRIHAASGPFENQYELSSYLFDQVRALLGKDANQEAMGHADWLLDLLNRTDTNSREALGPLLSAVKPEFEKRPIAEQLIDLFVAGDKDRYALLEEIRTVGRDGQGPMEVVHLALGRFLEHWVALEKAISRIAERIRGGRQMPHFSINAELRLLAERGVVDSAYQDRFRVIQRVRNMVLHGASVAAPDVLADATREAIDLLRQLGETEVEAAGLIVSEAVSQIRPPEAKIADNARKLASDLRALVSIYRRDKRTLDEAPDEETRRKVLHYTSDERGLREYVLDQYARVGVQVIETRRKMVLSLGESAPREPRIDYRRPADPLDIESIAEDLETLAYRLSPP